MNDEPTISPMAAIVIVQLIVVAFVLMGIMQDYDEHHAERLVPHLIHRILKWNAN